MFVYGLYMWGCAWEKTTGDPLDAPPRLGPTPLPVIHITVVPQSEKQCIVDPQRSAVSFFCPCYCSRICSREPVLLLDIDNKFSPDLKVYAQPKVLVYAQAKVQFTCRQKFSLRAAKSSVYVQAKVQFTCRQKFSLRAGKSSVYV